MPMQWSQLKARVESLLAPSLAGRVTLHQARYRHSNEEVGRVWIAVDGREIADFATHKGWRGVRELADRLMDERSAWGSPAAYAQATNDVEQQLQASGELSDTAALRLLEDYLSLPFEDALRSTNPLLRCMSLLDRRLGKRRLRAIRVGNDDPAFVRELYTIRCQAEQVAINASAL